jgi:hypothetical protein
MDSGSESSVVSDARQRQSAGARREIHNYACALTLMWGDSLLIATDIIT